MEKQPISSHDGLFLEDTCYFSSLYMSNRFHTLNLQKVDKWDHMSHILEREEKEFQEAMRTEVGTTSFQTNSLSKMKYLKVFTGTGIITKCKKRSQNFGPCLFLCVINFCTD